MLPSLPSQGAGSKGSNVIGIDFAVPMKIAGAWLSAPCTTSRHVGFSLSILWPSAIAWHWHKL